MPGKNRRHTLHYVVERNAKHFPERKAVVCGHEKSVTWGQLDANANRLANSLLKLGVRQGEGVGVMLRNSNMFFEAFIAGAKIGARMFNVNYRYKDRELLYLLDNAEARVLFCNPEYEGVVDSVKSRLPGLDHVIVCGGVPADPSRPSYRTLLDDSSESRPKPPWGPGGDDTIMLFYTGGTTGMPKGVIWTWGDITRFLGYGVVNTLVKNLKMIRGSSEEALERLLDTLGLPMANGRFTRVLYRRAISSGRVMEYLGWAMERAAFSPPGWSPLVRQFGRSLGVLVGSPLMHGAAWVVSVPVMSAGGTVYLLPDSPRFDPAAMWEMASRQRIPIVLVVGDAYVAPMVECLGDGDYDLDNLLVLGTGAVKLSPNLKEELHRRLPNTMILDSLLATEGGGAVYETTTRSSEIDADTRFQVRYRGRFPVRVLDDEGKPVRAGSGRVGTLIYGGPQSRGYWKDPDKTASTYIEHDGQVWLSMGDLCTVNEDGSINLMGRGTTCINTGGEKVYPIEIENVLMSHPRVRDVAVLGVPHGRWGEAVTAVIELDGNEGDEGRVEKELSEFMHDELADYKCPKHWVLVESLGRSDSGKLPFCDVRRIALEKLGIEES